MMLRGSYFCACVHYSHHAESLLTDSENVSVSLDNSLFQQTFFLPNIDVHKYEISNTIMFNSTGFCLIINDI